MAAVSTLTGLAAVAPWPFGSVSEVATGTITILGAAVGGGACLALLWHRRALPVLPLVGPLAGLLVLGVVQLVPLPASWHNLLASGSAAVWHPTESAAAEVLGAGARPISIHPDATRRTLAFATTLVGLVLLAAPALSHRRTAVAVAVVVAMAGLCSAIFGIASHLLFANLLFGRLAVPTVAPFGSFVSKNHFAGYVEMAALLTLGLALGLADQSRRTASFLSWIDSRRATRVIAAFGAAAAMILAVLVSQSRGGAIALVSGLLSFIVLHWWKRRLAIGRAPAIAAITAFALLAVLVFLVLPRRSQERLQGLSRASEDPAGAFRLGMWKDSVRAGRASPVLGWGLGTFADALPPYKTSSGELRVEHAENDGLELFVEGGLAGLGLMLAAGMLLFLGLIAPRGPEESRLHAGLATGAAAGVVALAVHGLVDFNLHVPSNALLFSLLAALTLGWQMHRPGERLLRAPAGALALALAAALVGSATGIASLPRPDLASLRGRTASGMRSKLIETALRRHLQRRPADAEAWVLLGWVRGEGGDLEGGKALATYGASRDPQRRELVEVAEKLGRPAAKP